MSKSGSEKSAEKPSFSQTCSLLSQYLKEKGSFGDRNLGFSTKSEAKGKEAWTTMVNLSDINPMNMPGSSNIVNSMDFFQQLPRKEPSTSGRDTTAPADFREPEKLPEPENGQLTIFFGGQVLVYDEFPTDKAKEIMDLAKQAGSKSSAGPIPDPATGKTSSGSLVIPDLNVPSTSLNENDHPNRQHEVLERIARRASLHRFFAKRKDRAAARAPYQLNHNAAPPPKPEEASPSHQGKNDLRPEEQTDQLVKEDQCPKDLELRL